MDGTPSYRTHELSHRLIGPVARRRSRQPSGVLRSGDHQALAELLEAVLPGFTDLLAPESSGPAEFLDDPASFVFGAYVEDVPAGLAWGIQMRSPNGRLTTYLHELDVHDEYRRPRARHRADCTGDGSRPTTRFDAVLALDRWTQQHRPVAVRVPRRCLQAERRRQLLVGTDVTRNGGRTNPLTHESSRLSPIGNVILYTSAARRENGTSACAYPPGNARLTSIEFVGADRRSRVPNCAVEWVGDWRESRTPRVRVPLQRCRSGRASRHAIDRAFRTCPRARPARRTSRVRLPSRGRHGRANGVPQSERPTAGRSSDRRRTAGSVLASP